MIAARDPARDLEIQKTVPHPVPAHRFFQNEVQRFIAERLRYTKRRQRTRQPREMAALVNQCPTPDFADLVNAVA